MIKRLTSILVLWCCLGIITVAGSAEAVVENTDITQKEKLEKGKKDIEMFIQKLDFLSDKQKQDLTNELNTITESNKLTEIENKASILNTYVGGLIELNNSITTAYDDDIFIRDNIGKDIFINLRFKSKDIKGAKSFLSNLGSIELGAGYTIKDGIAKGLKIGGFVGYTGGTKYNQVNTGISFNYYDYTGFVRYRYNKVSNDKANNNKAPNLNIHMLDIYNKYGYTNTIYDVILGVYGDLLLTNRFESKYDSKTIVNNFSVNGGIGFNVGYDFKKLLNQDLKVILRQRIDLSYKRINIVGIASGYNDFILNNVRPYSLFNYTVGLKVDYSYKNYGIALSSDVDIKLRTTSNISLSYMW